MTTNNGSFQAFFNRLPHAAKVRLSNRRIQQLECDLAFCAAFGVTHEQVKTDDWFLYDPAALREAVERWYDVRDRLVWDGEEVSLD